MAKCKHFKNGKCRLHEEASAAFFGKSQTAGSVCGWCRGNGAVMYPQLQECRHCDGTGVTPNRVIGGKSPDMTVSNE